MNRTNLVGTDPYVAVLNHAQAIGTHSGEGVRCLGYGEGGTGDKRGNTRNLPAAQNMPHKSQLLLVEG